jgi:hypothetical protein
MLFTKKPLKNGYMQERNSLATTTAVADIAKNHSGRNNNLFFAEFLM